jgi:hypothetical protein
MSVVNFDWINRQGPSRILSLLIAIAYLLICFFLKQPKSAVDVLEVLFVSAAALVFPVLCIWYGDELGDYVGTFPGPGITTRSPGWLVKTGGWVLLLLPAIVGWFVYRS